MGHERRGCGEGEVGFGLRVVGAATACQVLREFCLWKQLAATAAPGALFIIIRGNAGPKFASAFR